MNVELKLYLFSILSLNEVLFHKTSVLPSILLNCMAMSSATTELQDKNKPLISGLLLIYKYNDIKRIVETPMELLLLNIF